MDFSKAKCFEGTKDIPFSERKGLTFQKCMYVCPFKPIRIQEKFAALFYGPNR
jgi:hypothetical protein